MSKIFLTDEEFDTLGNQDFLLTKARVSQKMEAGLHQLAETIQKHPLTTSFAFPPKTKLQQWKVAKGERYRDLPYWVLDFPCCFERQDIFTFRTMCWWGHEFSFSLHLAGKYQQQYQNVLSEKLMTSAAKDYYLGVNTDPWEYHFGSDNLKSISELQQKDIVKVLEEFSHIKLVSRLELKHYNELQEFVIRNYEGMLALLEA